MKILLLHQYFLEEDDPGGSRWNEMAKSWTDEGNEVTVIAGMMHYNGDEKRKVYKKKYFSNHNQGNIRVIRTHVSESYNNGFLGRLNGYISFMISSILAGIFKVSGKFDAIVVTSPPLFIGISGYLISRIKRAPMVFEVRDLWPESAIDTGILTNKWIIKLAYKVEAFLYKKSTLINVLTPAFRTKLIEKGVPKEKIIFIPNAADFNLAEKLAKDFDPIQFKKDLGFENNMVITYVGAHGVANHLIQVLDAAEKLTNTNVIFQLIGSGMQKKALMMEAVSRNITNVVFRDPVPKSEVFKYILASDMGASILKKVDTFKTVYSNKTFDYFSCKKPVLMAIGGISAELIKEADAGTYVEPENALEYNRVIRDYIADPERLNREGENGFNFAKKDFDRIVLAEKFIKQIKLALSIKDIPKKDEVLKYNRQKDYSVKGISVQRAKEKITTE
ncbi:glycosyltransferase involved in cell wall biosynthesis [Gillisia sp. Hel_I_86]|uniref:glycosyltransferase family 4 protein n=1 Tax=Gillisia sp. Hel_I_86 TaxID=1249981 RepID=UPI0011999E6E|nr:glycosyltransferase family 4 protein [Gillisia sp. Hel_I_86]TVZ26037.1 glycosyltransferase involved in cell wall biosynthesis [Gillisia sp. Hel_I_86]